MNPDIAGRIGEELLNCNILSLRRVCKCWAECFPIPPGRFIYSRSGELVYARNGVYEILADGAQYLLMNDTHRYSVGRKFLVGTAFGSHIMVLTSRDAIPVIRAIFPRSQKDLPCYLLSKLSSVSAARSHTYDVLCVNNGETNITHDHGELIFKERENELFRAKPHGTIGEGIALIP